MRLPPTFSPLRHRNYRLYFTGQFFSLLGGWMQDTGRAWLVTLLATQVAPTHAEAERLASYYLGMLLTVGSLPMLFGSLFGGVIADRVSKRRLIFWSQSVQMLLSLAMAALVATGKAQVSHVFLFAILMGLTMVVDMPARQAFVVELVGKEDLPSAVGLNSSLFNGSRMLGPALAGILIGAAGGQGERAIALCFALNGFSFLTLLLGLALMRGDFSAKATGKEGALVQLREAAGYLKTDAPVRTLLLLLACYSIFTVGDWALTPSLARFSLGADAAGFGLLTSLKGIGAWIGALLIATLASSPHRTRLLMVAAIVSPLVQLAIALSGRFWLAAVLMPLNGLAVVSFLATANGLLQTSTPDALRGRMMGVHGFLMVGLNPVGGLLIGALAQKTSAPVAMATGALCALTCGALITLRSRKQLRALGLPPELRER